MNWKSLISEALDYDVEASDISSIEKDIESGDCQLWESENSAMVTKGFHTADGSIGVRVIAAAGVYDEVLKLLADLEAQARASGVKMLVTTGRKGWRKTAKHLQWKEVAVTLAKELN